MNDEIRNRLILAVSRGETIIVRSVYEGVKGAVVGTCSGVLQSSALFNLNGRREERLFVLKLNTITAVEPFPMQGGS
jgi:hypothetical protein